MNHEQWKIKAEHLLTKLMNRAYMRLDYREADEIADFLGLPRPTDHELADVRPAAGGES